jgi:23S rRNA (adenine2030-N6)-methyltransferase
MGRMLGTHQKVCWHKPFAFSCMRAPPGDAFTVAPMLAYRHAFHAGNHADVLKHTVLTMVLRYMNQKDKPYRLVDTHAGAGGYSLEGHYAQKKGEFEQGIARLWDRDDLPEAVADYVTLVRAFNSGGPLRQYPGSPAFAQMLLREKDQLRLFELHNTDHRILETYLGKERGVQVMNSDGFEGLKGHVPPSSRRGVVLMDPSYEGHADYGKVISSLRDALTRFAEGVYMVWYPQVTKLEAAQLPRRLEALAPKGWLHARLTVQVPDSQGFGLAGSGMFILNPPYTLHDELLKVLPYLVDVLGQYDDAEYLLEHRAA